jgi:hypothetical protein
MYAYCWASGLIQFGRKVPEGAIAIASGPAEPLRDAITTYARHGKGASTGCLLVPGVPEAPESPEDKLKGDALAAWLDWCAARRPDGITFSRMEA